MGMPDFLNYGSFDDPRTQVMLATLTGYLRVNPDVARVDSIFRASNPGNFVAGEVPFSILNTYTVWYKWDRFYLVLSGGTIGTTHVGPMIVGWNNPIQDPANFGASDAFAIAADAIWRGIGSANIADGYTWILAGHSYGGSQLAAFAAVLKDQRPSSNIYGFSYGSPRPGTPSLQDRSRGWNWVRWFNDTDPVVRIPPHTNEGAILASVLPDQLQLGCNRQVQPFTGRMINPDGTWQEQEQTNFPLVFSELALAAWIVGTNAFGAAAHSISEYVRRFGIMPLPTARPRLSSSPATSPDSPLVATSRERIRMVDTAVQQLQGEPFPPGNISFVPPKKGDRYRIKKESGTWMVYFNSDPFCIGGTKRQARKIARAGNKQIAAVPPVNILA